MIRWPSGEKATWWTPRSPSEDRASSCSPPSSPRAHTRAPSGAPEASLAESGLQAIPDTPQVWPASRKRCSPVSADQTATVRS